MLSKNSCSIALLQRTLGAPCCHPRMQSWRGPAFHGHGDSKWEQCTEPHSVWRNAALGWLRTFWTQALSFKAISLSLSFSSSMFPHRGCGALLRVSVSGPGVELVRAVKTVLK